MKVRKILFGFILIIFATTVWAKYMHTILVLDMRNAPKLPERFRMVTDPVTGEINSQGFSDLHIAGGAQFSNGALNKIAQRLKTKKFVVIDLRQESHGMLDGNAVSWYGPQNAQNSKKTNTQIEDEQTSLLMALGEKEIATVNKIIQKSQNGEIEKVKPIEYLVHETSTEEELVNAKGFKYKRVFVQDFHAPTNKEVDRFIEMVNAIPKERWIYFHCRSGIGRTTEFMSMYDMLYNAKAVSFEDILARQTAIGGKNFNELPEKNSFKYKWAVNRLEFLKKFYQYAHDNKDHYKTNWSEWLKSQ